MDINFILRGTGLSGGSRAIFEIADVLTKMGHEVRLVYPAVPLRRFRDGIDIYSYLSQLIVAWRRFREDDPAEWFDPVTKLKLVPTLSTHFPRLVNAFVPDADVSIATTWETAYTVAALNAQKGEKYYFVQHYEVWPLWDDPSCWNKAATKGTDPSVAMADIVPEDEWKRRYKHRVDRSYELPLSVIITSEWEREVLNRLGQSSVESIKYGVNFDMFHPIEIADDHTLTVLAPYRNQPNKGDKEAIHAFEVLNRKCPDVEFAMYGTELTPVVPDFVTFYEDVDQHKLKDVYSQADVFVFPSWVEGFGMPPMEAMACRTALVSTSVGGVPEYTPEDGVRIVPIQDSDAIIREVVDLVDDRDQIERMKECNQRYIQRFTWEKAAKKFVSILK